jgi:hypothetical protein
MARKAWQIPICRETAAGRDPGFVCGHSPAPLKSALICQVVRFGAGILKTVQYRASPAFRLWQSGRMVAPDSMQNPFLPVIDGLNQEVERLEGIAARFEKSHSIHLNSVLEMIGSNKRRIDWNRATSRFRVMAQIEPLRNFGGFCAY